MTILTLQRFIDSDPVLCAIHQGSISWYDAFMEDGEDDLPIYGTRGAGVEVMTDAHPFKEREKPHLRWADEVTVCEMPSVKPVVPAVSAKPFTPTISANPCNIKTLFVRNLPRDVTVAEMQTMFAPFGALHDVYVPKNTTPGKYFGTIKGFALIKYKHYSESTRAFLDIGDTFHLRGKEVSIEFAKQDQH
jgi:hypothetical protein